MNFVDTLTARDVLLAFLPVILQPLIADWPKLLFNYVHWFIKQRQESAIQVPNQPTSAQEANYVKNMHNNNTETHRNGRRSKSRRGRTNKKAMA